MLSFYRDVSVEGKQTEEGKDMVIIGNMANGNGIEEYALIQRVAPKTLLAFY